MKKKKDVFDAKKLFSKSIWRKKLSSIINASLITKKHKKVSKNKWKSVKIGKNHFYDKFI